MRDLVVAAFVSGAMALLSSGGVVVAISRLRGACSSELVAEDLSLDLGASNLVSSDCRSSVLAVPDFIGAAVSVVGTVGTVGRSDRGVNVFAGSAGSVDVLVNVDVGSVCLVETVVQVAVC